METVANFRPQTYLAGLLERDIARCSALNGQITLCLMQTRASSEADLDLLASNARRVLRDSDIVLLAGESELALVLGPTSSVDPDAAISRAATILGDNLVTFQATPWHHGITSPNEWVKECRQEQESEFHFQLRLPL